MIVAFYEAGLTAPPVGRLGNMVPGEVVVRLGDVVVILDLHRQGLSVTAIAERVGVDRKTVR